MIDELELIKKTRNIPTGTMSEKINVLEIGECAQVATFHGYPVLAQRIDDPEVARFVIIKSQAALKQLSTLPLDLTPIKSQEVLKKLFPLALELPHE